VSFATTTLCVASQRVFVIIIVVVVVVVVVYLVMTQSGNFWLHPRMPPSFHQTKNISRCSPSCDAL